MSDRDWEEFPVRVGTEQHEGDIHKIEFSNLQASEHAALKALLHGTAWVTVHKGRLKASPTFLPAPTPLEDPAMAPFWPSMPIPDNTTIDMFPQEYETYSPGFIIQHLCGYGYSPEGYKTEADKLTEWGFSCMRSQRGEDGQYWEMWYLPGLWAAKGRMRDELKATPRDRKAEADAVATFLCQNARFGTLDIKSQRAAMTID
jgi:hypothetical protein